MGIEKMVEILGKVNGKNYFIVKRIADASSMAKSYKRYIIELWDFGCKGQYVKNLILSVCNTGIVTGEHLEELDRNTEDMFIQKIMKMVDVNKLSTVK